MNEAALMDLTATIADRLCGKNERICVALIRQLAAGQPVSVAHLASAIAMEEPAVRAVADGDLRAVRTAPARGSAQEAPRSDADVLHDVGSRYDCCRVFRDPAQYHRHPGLGVAPDLIQQGPGRGPA